MSRRIVVGDIHGCYDELQELLSKAGAGEDDEIIALGDIVDRGPDTPRVLEFFRARAKSMSILGNHERKHLRSSRGETRPALSQLITRQQLGEPAYREALEFLGTFPLFLEHEDVIMTHGFFEPGIPLAGQKDVVLAGTLSGASCLAQKFERPWYEYYDGEKPLVVGHLDYLKNGSPLIYRDRVFGLDTGCCRGGALTALILPEFRIVSVPSRGNHWELMQREYKSVVLKMLPDETAPWDKIAGFLHSVGRQDDIDEEILEYADAVRETVARAEAALGQVFLEIKAEHARAIERLRKQCDYDSASEREQGSLYAAAVRGHPLERFLHIFRRGRLARDDLRKFFKSPADALGVAQPGSSTPTGQETQL